MNRRSFFGKTLGALAGLFCLGKVGFSKQEDKKEDVSQEFMLLNTFWDYCIDDLDPIDYIKGQPVKRFMFDVVSGYGCNSDLVHYWVYPLESKKVTSEAKYKELLPSVHIDPFQISKCNVREGWVEYVEVEYWLDKGKLFHALFQPKKDVNGNVQYRKVYLSDMKVEILGPKGEVLCILTRKNDKCTAI